MHHHRLRHQHESFTPPPPSTSTGEKRALAKIRHLAVEAVRVIRNGRSILAVSTRGTEHDRDSSCHTAWSADPQFVSWSMSARFFLLDRGSLCSLVSSVSSALSGNPAAIVCLALVAALLTPGGDAGRAGGSQGRAVGGEVLPCLA